MSPGYAISLRADAKMEVLHLACTTLRALCDAAGVEGDEADRMELALSEGLTNAIRHGQRGQGGQVALDLGIEDGVLTMRITDRGPGFCLDGVASPDTEHHTEGGYGVFIMREVMDSVSYAPGEGGNVLTLTRRFAGKGEGEG